MAAAVENIFIPDSQWYPLNPYLNNNEQGIVGFLFEKKLIKPSMNLFLRQYRREISIENCQFYDELYNIFL